jgi:glycosyltransferase involved in cell wall biosynthesis
MDKPTISVVINTYNEEANIKKCIESVLSFADEIVVCDMYSEDNTVSIAQSYGATIIYHEKVGFVEPARYFAISNAKGMWILVLDADEFIEENVKIKLKELILKPDVDLITLGKL